MTVLISISDGMDAEMTAIMIGALDKPTQGRVIIDGVETSRMAESRLYKVCRERMGFIFQACHLVPTLDALQNVLVPVLPIRGNKRYYMKAVRLLKLVGFKDRLHHKPGELSGGERQRVAIARSLVMDPILYSLMNRPAIWTPRPVQKLSILCCN